MDCRNALAKLYEYIDGEIGHAEREAIAAHVKACRHCFDQFEAERLFAEFVERRTPRPEARQEFKSRLLARLAEEPVPVNRPSYSTANVIPVWTRFAVAALLVLGIGVGAAWVQDEAGPQRVDWRTLAMYHHENAPVEEVGLETADYGQARAFLAAQMNPGVAQLLPASAPPGVGLHECCVMPWGDDRLGRLAFDGGEADGISLFIIPASRFQFADEARLRVADNDYRTVKLGCCRAVCWNEGGEYVCMMFGDCHANDLLAYAEAWKAAQNVRSSGGSLPPKSESTLSSASLSHR